MTDKTMTLEPCPFCGCKDNLGRVYSGTYSEYYVQCFDCGARGPVHADDNDACGAWSNRHLSQPAERGEAQEKAEPVAVIGPVWQLLWFDSESTAAIAKKHGLKVGDKLYTAPPPAAGVPDVKHIPPPGADVNHERESAYVDGWNACRSAMLSATPSPTIDVAAVPELVEALPWVSDPAVVCLRLADGTQCDVYPEHREGDTNMDEQRYFLESLARAIGDAK